MSEPVEHKPINPWSIWVPIIIMVLGVVVLYNYLVIQSMQRDKDRPPYLAKLEKDLDGLTERSGKTVNLGMLKGKVLVVGYVYTSCPRGCALVVAEMKKIYDELAPKHPGLQMVSFTIDPDDSPDHMKTFATARGITDDRWWFVNGPKEKVRGYLSYALKFYGVREIPEKDRFSPTDKYEHDMRVAIVDHKANVRGMFNIADGDPELQQWDREKIRKHLLFLLAEQEKEAAAQKP